MRTLADMVQNTPVTTFSTLVDNCKVGIVITSMVFEISNKASMIVIAVVIFLSFSFF